MSLGTPRCVTSSKWSLSTATNALEMFARQHEELRSRFWHRCALSFHPFAHLLPLRRRPRSEQLSDGDDLREMVGRVIDRDQECAQVCLSGPARDFRRQVLPCVGGEALESHAVLSPGDNALV